MKIALVSNVTIDLLQRMLKKEDQYWIADGFGNWIQPCIDASSSLYEFSPDIVFVILDGGELFPGNISDAQSQNALKDVKTALKMLVKNLGNAMVCIGTIDIPQERFCEAAIPRRERQLEEQIYNCISNLVATYNNCCIFDLKLLVEELGRNQFYDYKMKTLGGMPFSLKALSAMKGLIEAHIRAYNGKRSKVLALDLDNTLWKGVIGEDGVDGVKLAPDKSGMPYSYLQARAKDLRGMGILLTIISKNNEGDVKDILNSDKMVLHKDDFVEMRINWDSKPENLTKQAKRLNLGKDSFVFIDDNPVEREAIKQIVPEVKVPEFPADASLIPQFMKKVYIDYFFTLRTTSEDRQKTQAYQAENARHELEAESDSVESYLKRLNISVEIKRAAKDSFERISQLTQKTNQFNLTTRRYSFSEICSMAETPDWLIVSASSSDMFGSNGLIAVMIVKINNDSKIAIVDDLLMSCRVMGRTIEHALLSAVENYLVTRGINRIEGEYIKTAKNAPVKDFWDKMNYIPIVKGDESAKYFLPLPASRSLTTYAKVKTDL